MRFLVLFAQHDENFRIQELLSLAEMEGIHLNADNYNPESPFMEVDLESEEVARKLVYRSFLTRGIYRIIAQGANMDEVHEMNKKPENLAVYKQFSGKSFKVEFNCYQGTRSKESQLQEINKLAYTNIDGPISLKNPEIRIVFLEKYQELAPEPEYIWLTSLVSTTARPAVDKYDLKKRKFVGTTSFEAELALVTTNLAQIKKGDIVFDPFSGTGSFPLAAAYHGASVFAADIDIRPLRNYRQNFEQYNTKKCFIDALEMDFTHSAFNDRLKFDAIICDPPYGVRERIVVCGAAKPERFVGKEFVMVDNELSHRRRDYIPTKKPIELGDMLQELLDFSARKLNVGRRLSFWLPVEDRDVENTAIPLHTDLEFKSMCVQRFARWQRWLLTYERRAVGDKGPEKPIHVKKFRDSYYNMFKHPS